MPLFYHIERLQPPHKVRMSHFWIVKNKELFKEVLYVDIGDISNLVKFILKRHDFIHRGGKDTKGKEVITTKLEVEDLIKAVEDFCAAIDKKNSLSGKGT